MQRVRVWIQIHSLNTVYLSICLYPRFNLFLSMESHLLIVLLLLCLTVESVHSGVASSTHREPKDEENVHQLWSSLFRALNSAELGISDTRRVLGEIMFLHQRNASLRNYNIKPIRELLELSNVNRAKCNSFYLKASERMSIRHISGSLNILPYIIHQTTQQIVLCDENLDDLIRETVQNMSLEDKCLADTLGKEILKPLETTLATDRRQSIEKIGELVRKTMRCFKDNTLPTKVLQFLDLQLDSLLPGCARLSDALGPHLDTYERYPNTDSNQLDESTLNWLRAGINCNQITLFISLDQKSILSAFLQNFTSRANSHETAISHV